MEAITITICKGKNFVYNYSSLYFKLHRVTTSMNTTRTLGKLALLMTISVVFVLVLFVFFIFACASVGIAVWFLISAISVIIVIGLLSGFFVSSVTREAGAILLFLKNHNKEQGPLAVIHANIELMRLRMEGSGLRMHLRTILKTLLARMGFEIDILIELTLE